MRVVRGLLALLPEFLGKPALDGVLDLLVVKRLDAATSGNTFDWRARQIEYRTKTLDYDFRFPLGHFGAPLNRSLQLCNIVHPIWIKRWHAGQEPTERKPGCLVTEEL